MREVALLIRNETVAASNAATFERINPVSHDVVTRAAAASIEDAEHAANVAASAFPAWSSTSPGARRELLNRAANLLLSRAGEFTELITAETGGTRQWGEFNCRLGATILQEAAAMTTQLGGEVIPADKQGCFAMAVRQPCGVVLSLAPWNAPVILGVRSLAMPLACGNPVIFKASELCPGTHGLIGEVFHEAGFPAGSVNVVSSAPEDASRIVETLVAHPAVRRVNFTGSTRVGRTIAEVCARHLKRCLLELGGKAPLIVLDDADLGEAAKAASFGAFYHQGQICISTERVIVHESVAEEFVGRFAERAAAIKPGDPRDPDCKLGSMITEQAAQRVEALIDDAVRKGAKLICGGERRDVFVEATILDGVTPDMRIYYEETFGPVASVIRFADVEEAISIANDTEYGLAAAVFGRDVTRALQVAQRIESGICHVNASTVHDEPQMPFGGVKASGYGRFGGKAGIDEFTELRWITIQTGPGQYPI
jgi:acyl-CoA reductase-like NAD-dependent aldehyde dehydrogenase